MAETHSFVTFRVEGAHSWPDAPTNLLHLRSVHRHMFYFKVTFPQDEDRGIEFHEFKQYAEVCVRTFYGRTGPHSMFVDFQERSCEVIADTLARALLASARFHIREVCVSVSEDGEFGSVAMMSLLDLA